MGVGNMPVSAKHLPDVRSFKTSLPLAQPNEEIVHVKFYFPHARLFKNIIRGVAHYVLILKPPKDLTETNRCLNIAGAREDPRSNFLFTRE